MLLAISFAIISEIDSLKHANLLICCLQVGNIKMHKNKAFEREKKKKKTSQLFKYISHKQTYADVYAQEC